MTQEDRACRDRLWEHSYPKPLLLPETVVGRELVAGKEGHRG